MRVGTTYNRMANETSDEQTEGEAQDLGEQLEPTADDDVVVTLMTKVKARLSDGGY